MNYRLVVRPAVEEDIAEAEAWYDEQRAGLGREFIETIRRALKALPTRPLIYRIRHRRSGIRWFYPRRFPYRIVYRVRGEEIVVLAVLHAARHDRHWKSRV